MSFADSLKNSKCSSDINDISELSIEPSILSTKAIVDDTGSTDSWQRVDGYKWFNYTDNNISSVNEDKSISVNPKQVNITQEENSQFIPFEMNRFYDGIDLKDTIISIHYSRNDNKHASSQAVNVEYNNDRIRFAWLLDRNATGASGVLRFEIRAEGSISDSNGNSYAYIWKTKTDNSLNVLQSLCGKDDTIDVDNSWVQEIVERVTTKVTEKIADAQIGEQVEQAKQYAAAARVSADNAVDAVNTELAKKNYADKSYVDNAVKGVDVSEQLKDYAKKTDLPTAPTKVSQLENDSNYLTGLEASNLYVLKSEYPDDIATKEYVQSELSKVDVSEQLKDYAKKDLVYTKQEVNDAISNVSVDLSGYYTKSEVDTKTGTLSSSINKNTQNVSNLSKTVSDLQTTVDGIDTSPRLTYDVKYNDTEDSDVGKNVFVFYEIQNEGEENEVKSAKAKFTITGGSGGGTTSSSLKVEYITKTPLVVTLNDRVVIQYNFSGTDSSGDQVLEGTAVWKVGNSTVATNTATSGVNEFDITDFISIGTQKVNLSITDDAGSLVTKNWTIQKIDVRLESSFNDKLTYPIGNIAFDYTPYGAIAKDVHFVLDQKEIGKVETNSSGIPMSYSLPTQTHGTHLLDVYMTAEINNNTIESNHITKDIIWYDEESDIPVIGCVQQNITVKQYDITNIVYTVYDPTTETPEVILAVDGKVLSTLTLDNNTQTWQYKSTDAGKHVLTITCGKTIKTINVTVEKLDIDIEPVTAGLAFDFNPVGKSNNDTDRLWTDANNSSIKMTVSENFDWVNGGYQLDENGDQYFGIKAGTTAVISYDLFADDARRNGKEFKFIFKTTNVSRSDAIFLNCESGTTTPIGLQMNVHEAYIKSSAKSLYIPYSEEDIIEWEFNINKDSDIPIVMSYEDGTPCRPMSYTNDYSFTQESPVPITIGSPDCDVMIYRMKAYNTSLTSSAILSNFIADARTATEMIDRYNRNQIYDENNLLTPDSVANACPDMRIIKIESPIFTNDKKNYIKNASMQCIYKNGDPILDNWQIENGYVVGQGTTSNSYGQAGRNLDYIFCADGAHQINSKIDLDPDYKSKITFGDNSTVDDGTGKISLTRNSIPTNWLNIKVNIASSEMVNNAYLQKRYNDYLPYKSPAQKRDSKVKNDMEFVNCVIFIKESEPDISTHREFQDTEWHFYALGNIGDSKKTDLTRAYDSDDMNEFCIEISDNTLPNSIFQTGVTNSDGSMKYPITKAEWKSGNEAYDNLYNNWDGSFEFRYDCCGDSKDGDPTSTDEAKQEIRTKNRQIWRDFYRFVITSTDEEFKSNLKNWFIVDSALYFYLFTLRYTMIDNRAKNVFFHYAKHYINTKEAESLGNKAAYYTIDDSAASINNGYRFDFWDYDNDSSLGINNSGELTMTYGKEDTDYRTDGDPSSGYIFNAAESVFFCRVRDLMKSQLVTTYQSCESKNCWSANSLINEFDQKQNEWCEELWRLDYVRKYERTYKEGNTRFLEQMMNGKKKYQRRQFERDQEIYIATKFLGTTATSDQIMFRCNTPVGATIKPNYTLHLTPYSDMYLSVMFGNSSPTQIRAKAGQQYDITCPYETMDDTAVLIYAASRIQSVGDISTCYIHDNDFSKAERLKELIIGNTTAGYSNTFLTNLVIGNNKLLEKLDIRNTPNLVSSLDLSKCMNLREFYASGSGLKGILFANGGNIRTAQLPETLTSINMRNLIYLTDLRIAGYDFIATVILENCNTIDTKDLIEKSPKINRARIIGVNWQLDNTDLLKRIYSMAGIDKNGYNATQSVLTGSVHVPVMKEHELRDYNTVWSDLEITYDSIIEQYTVKFVNTDGSVLDVQYIDKGQKPVDPITRKNNPIATPTKESSVQYDYTYKGWDSEFIPVFENLTYTATYSESLRSYTIRYVSKSKVLQETTAAYGTTVFYTGDVPTYVTEEGAYKYYLFSRWDKSGYVNGDKTVNAIYDSCSYTTGYFNGKDLSTLRPVELYTLTKVGIESSVIESMDDFSFTMGNDYDYDDITSNTLINSKTDFTGSNYVDTNLALLDTDKDFVLAVDYEFADGNSVNSTLMQCFKSDGSDGFRLFYNSNPRIQWGTSATQSAVRTNREMLVLRHIKGENNLHVYTSDISNTEIGTIELERNKSTTTSSTLVFGCVKADDGSYEQYAKGSIYWAKVWFADLGDDVCKSLAAYTHEEINMQMCGFKRKYLADNSGKRSSMTFLASKVLRTKKPLDSAYSNKGGWANVSLNTWLNTRFYNGLPTQIRQLIKLVKVNSSIGNQSTEISTSNCYVYIPALIEVSSNNNNEPYINEDTAIDYMVNNTDRIRKDYTNTAVSYITRSPNVESDIYYWYVQDNGSTSGYGMATQDYGILVEFNI
uniref:DUF6273 domain-containing protein n=1 Tax=Coprococcus catus TaxID=116085 RepID=UPI0022E2F3EE|nr:DUF6273 domain-containing protein [Coprococcus catus]